ncbi:MAG: Ig-like domain-containing protein [Synergistaceae bacterium]|nr:Ig-like domain-containing protein [Synergistaceae bacterium]
MGAARNAPALTSADVVYYGSYPQSGTSPDFKVEPILWRVLDAGGDRSLLLSELILDAGIAFNPDVDRDDPYASWWSESQIRLFLNGKEYEPSVSSDVTGIDVVNPKGYFFYEKAFSAGEGNGIIKDKVDNSVRYNYHTKFDAGPETEDKIFLLSYADVDQDPSNENPDKALGKKYGFDSYESHVAEATDYYLWQPGYNHKDEESGKTYGVWWLRSPGYYTYSESYLYYLGYIYDNYVNGKVLGIRPAFRLNLGCLLFTSPAAGGKQDGLTASLHKQSYTSDDKGKYEHKLTIATNTYKLMSADVTSGKITASSVDVTYSGASTGAGYYLAASVTSGDRALYYGRIKSLEASADKNGTVTFVIPEYHDGEEVYIFVEGRNNNGDYKTDFASVPICIAGTGRAIKPLPKDVEEPRPDTKSVTINPSELTLVIGYDKKLTASFAPEGALEEVTWSSDKPDIASADPVTGVVRALKAGSANVTAKAKTSGKEAFCTVTVIEKPLNPTLILTPAAMTVSRGMTEKITAVFQDITEQPLTWSSSDPTVATVDKEGKVTAKNEGTCVITAATEDGAYSASCEVKVTAAHHGGGSSGCSTAGFGLFALLISMPLLFRKSADRK